MEKEFITVRAARRADIPGMWRLLHCEGRCLDEAAIAAGLGNFYVLTRGPKLLGVYNAGDAAGWTAVHPLFGQDLVEDIMAKAVNGLLKINEPGICGVKEWSFNLTRRRSFPSISS
ncbi:MAG: hypothetical protein RIN56_13695 [Sporomusaceae bacterium]|nr:hypothetical protein [Sporomusaceae bacterium]